MKKKTLRTCRTCKGKYQYDGFSQCGPCTFRSAKVKRKKALDRKVDLVMAQHDTNKKALQATLCDAGVPGCSCNQSASMWQ